MVWACGCERRLRGGPLLVKVVGVEVFRRVVRVRVHTWGLSLRRGGVVVGAVAARRAAAVRRALASPPHVSRHGGSK